jgi:hypothetical protein
MIKELTSSNCSVFTFDTIGKDTDLFRDDKKSFEERNRSILRTPRQDSVSFMNTVSKGERTLGHMSNATGGKHFGHIDNYDKHLEKLQNITGSYYVLGYVTRPGCQVFAQKGYFNPKPFSEYSDLEKMIHLVDLALSEHPFQRPLDFPMQALPCSADKSNNLLLLSAISGDNIQDITGEKVEIVHIVFDEEDNIVSLQRRERSLMSTDFENLYDWKYYSLAPGKYKCRIVVRNLETGLGAVASANAVVAKKKTGAIQIFPPLVAVSGGNVSRGNALSSGIAPVYPLEEGNFPLIGPLPKATGVFSLILRCELGGIAEPELRLRFSLKNLDNGKTLPVDYALKKVMEGEDLRIFAVDLSTEPLHPGSYILHCFAEDALSRSVSQSYTLLSAK